jgi:hypothetical protein
MAIHLHKAIVESRERYFKLPQQASDLLSITLPPTVYPRTYSLAALFESYIYKELI